MASVGQQIRDQRLRLGLKLEDISARSRIPLRTLQAIETDDLANISSPFLYRSFARQFAEQLKLDYPQLAPTIESAALSMPQPRMPGEGEAGKTNIAPLPVKGCSKNFRWLYSLGSFGVVLVACSSLYGMWQTSKSTWLAELGGLVHPAKIAAPEKSREVPPSTSVAPVHVTAAIPAGHPRKSSLPVVEPENQNQTLAAAEPSPAVITPDLESSPDYHVELSAIERTWISIVEDGKQTFSGVLDPDQTKVLEGHDTARIRTGNAGGINCVFNGKPIGPLGPRGQVRVVVFTKSNYEVLDAAAHIALTQFPTIVDYNR